MDAIKSSAHESWNYNYPLVSVPKCRKNSLPRTQGENRDTKPTENGY
ncbi:hypothetical protein CLOSTMETH_03793 [[Clostridium] methylpentosum DSM 5476]|uniref:Uncharacterized protein n=1 Tax=[Clostridium] methylpentosum DSM 5476 TaxID=537013 RepID=C0EIU8_9FIRM|nr:hypothetical protein CLOSTMETH_03793 [[Clostridium] methylpentosum DSM 5476]